MSYKKEINFLLNKPFDIMSASTGIETEVDGDYDFADERFKSKITNRYCFITTNFGMLSFDSTHYDTEYEYHDGESNEWLPYPEKSSTSFTMKMGRTEVGKVEGNDYNRLLEFHEKIEGFGRVTKVSSLEDFITSEEMFDGERDYGNNNPVIKLTNLPTVILQAYIKDSPEMFEEINTDKLLEVNRAINNASDPRALLEKLATLFESAQVSTVYFAMNKTESDIDKLLARPTEHDPYADRAEFGY